MRWKVEFLEREPLEELIEKGKERRARIAQELFKLYEKEAELEAELYKEAAEILRHIDEGDFIARISAADDGLEFWTRRKRKVSMIFIGKDGSVAVQARNGTYIIGQRVVLL